MDRQTTFIAVSFNNNANSVQSVVVFFTTVNHLSQTLNIETVQYPETDYKMFWLLQSPDSNVNKLYFL